MLADGLVSRMLMLKWLNKFNQRRLEDVCTSFRHDVYSQTAKRAYITYVTYRCNQVVMLFYSLYCIKLTTAWKSVEYQHNPVQYPSRKHTYMILTPLNPTLI